MRANPTAAPFPPGFPGFPGFPAQASALASPYASTEHYFQAQQRDQQDFLKGEKPGIVKQGFRWTCWIFKRMLWPLGKFIVWAGATNFFKSVDVMSKSAPRSGGATTVIHHVYTDVDP